MSQNKNYYEFIFMGNRGKPILLRITNAKPVSDISQFASDMDFIISMDILDTSKGKPIAKRLVRYVAPSIIDVEIN